METQKLKDAIAEQNPEALLADGFDDALIGYGRQHGGKTVAIYDKGECINILFYQIWGENKHATEWDIMQEAIKYFEFNVECAYVGENTPIFMTYTRREPCTFTQFMQRINNESKNN